MEVKPGYKVTKSGIIPEDWDAPVLGELFNFKNGLNKAKQFFGEGTPIVNYMDVYGKRGLFSHDLIGRVTLSNKELKRYEVRKGDVCFTRTSETVEEIGISSVILDDPKDTVFSGFVLRARPKDNSLNDEFKKYCFSTNAVRKQIISQSVETTRALTNGRSLSVVEIARPPISEQEAIATALSDVDDLITSLDKLIAKKRLIRQGAMQELLTGNRRLPGFSGEWEVKKLGDVAEIVMGQSPSSIHYNTKGDGLPLVQGNADIYNRKTIKRVFTTEITKRGYCGDVLMSVRAPVGEVARALFDVCIGRGVCAVRFPNDFIYYALIAKEPFWVTLSKGSTFDSVTSKDVKTLEMDFPTNKEEQIAIAAILSDMDIEIAALEQRRDKTRLLKQGMMQELLTGKTRLV